MANNPVPEPAALAGVLTGYDVHEPTVSWRQIRVCQRAECAIAFLDVSRNGRRRFCSLRCANQVNVANHRRRQRPAA